MHRRWSEQRWCWLGLCWLGLPQERLSRGGERRELILRPSGAEISVGRCLRGPRHMLGLITLRRHCGGWPRGRSPTQQELSSVGRLIRTCSLLLAPFFAFYIKGEGAFLGKGVVYAVKWRPWRPDDRGLYCTTTVSSATLQLSFDFFLLYTVAHRQFTTHTACAQPRPSKTMRPVVLINCRTFASGLFGSSHF